MGYIACTFPMTVTLTMIRYRKRFIPFALLAMALFRFPLWMNKKIQFFKLLGSGRNGSFDKNPDWQQWGILTVRMAGEPLHFPVQENSLEALYGSFIYKWLRLFHCETWTVFLEPLESHGLWDGRKVFGELPPRSGYEGLIAVLTRATIRISRLGRFWSHVDAAAHEMSSATGFISSLGIGEIPWIKQATFSIWQSTEDMKKFAYGMKDHQEVIRLTRKEKWYREDMFTRFRITGCQGTLKGVNPLAGKL